MILLYTTGLKASNIFTVYTATYISICSKAFLVFLGLPSAMFVHKTPLTPQRSVLFEQLYVATEVFKKFLLHTLTPNLVMSTLVCTFHLCLVQPFPSWFQMEILDAHNHFHFLCMLNFLPI
jgi:hypothetical protein